MWLPPPSYAPPHPKSKGRRESNPGPLAACLGENTSPPPHLTPPLMVTPREHAQSSFLGTRGSFRGALQTGPSLLGPAHESSPASGPRKMAAPARAPFAFQRFFRGFVSLTTPTQATSIQTPPYSSPAPQAPPFGSILASVN